MEEELKVRKTDQLQNCHDQMNIGFRQLCYSVQEKKGKYCS